MRQFRGFFCLTALLAPLASAEDSSSLLDEVVAGCDANLELIECGSATYDVTELQVIDPGGADALEETNFEARIEFDGAKAAWRYKNTRVLRDDRHDASFVAPQMTEGEPASYHYAAIIEPRGTGPYLVSEFHPRYVGHAVESPKSTTSLADLIRSARKNSRIGLTAKAEGDLVHVSFDMSFTFVREDYVVDRARGYGVTMMTLWGLKLPDRAALEVVAEYERARNGAYIASRVRTISRRPVGAQYVDAYERIQVLREANIGTRPAPDRFTLKALGLPKGAWVTDKEQGKRFLYEVDAVTDAEVIEAAKTIQKDYASNRAAADARPHDPRSLYVGIGVALLLLVALASLGLLRRRAHRPKNDLPATN